MEFIDDRPVWTDEERAEIATEHDGYADRQEKAADGLEAKGYHDAARRYRQLAQDNRDVADAARISSAFLARIY